MSSIKDKLTALPGNIIKNKNNLGTKCLIFIVFICVSVYIYFNFVKPLFNKDYVNNREFVNNNYTDDVIIYFFYTEWCPHCKQAKPEWNAFKENINKNKTMYKTKIIFREIDCDKDAGTAEEYNVEGYPTIKLVWKADVYDYDAKPNRTHLLEFINGIVKN